ncbi:helix-turn-helix domain-containing protein [Listeria monocytogenes]|uniref:Helix-turn-helix domain-containing protein n=3 Tax=Listeria monocytogenes TaxID=1639 RepID=A0A5L8DLJ7_LISMN|nr:helix-turn-helix domain-containing protein [Listeria monocytogenes]EAH4210723.1 helix-turn-helix domain-containing protein [Listeria monocytogenes]EAH4223737.1 helix-turn-helix domain-containing protein [Listeria monocytogenes]EAK9702939.1 helix-turn-helix domain-containing protein [Listeria monocytogenes]EAK9751581.1 helix-turn-helix domain-containing protein [Listeria monocytogenes]
MEALNKKLFRLNSKEKIQKSTSTFVPDLPNGSFLKENGSMELLNDYFFKNKDIYISKHNRFADYPYHTHQFLELNYMYSGSSEQVIEGNKETLHEGELLLLDSGCHHSIKATGEKDILINILFRDQQISLEWLTSIKKKNSLLFDFLLHSSVSEQSLKKYIIFQSAQIPHIQQILNQIITEYFLEEEFSSRIITLYLPILFTELVRKCDTYLADDLTNSQSSTTSTMLEVIKLIESNYRTITLTSAADTLGYNKNYLSNFIKKNTNFTFTELVNKQKMLAANLLIETTSTPIELIIEKVGFSNKTYFYSLYKKTFNLLPNEVRNKK